MKTVLLNECINILPSYVLGYLDTTFYRRTVDLSVSNWSVTNSYSQGVPVDLIYLYSVDVVYVKNGPTILVLFTLSNMRFNNA